MVALAQEKPEPLLVREPEAARMLTLSPSKLAKMNKAGEIPALHAGRRKMYAVADLKAWIDRQNEVDLKTTLR